MFIYIISALVFIFFLLAIFIPPIVLFRIAFINHSNKGVVLNSQHNKLDSVLFDDKRIQEQLDWKETVNIEDIFTDSFDGLKLHAIMIKNPAKTGRWVIGAHGYTDTCVRFINYGAIKWFYEKGYNILIPDARSHGLSEGGYIGFGWPDRMDIIRWASVLIAGEPDCSISLYGSSMGAATVMMVSGETLPPNIKCIIEDCGYTCLRDQLAYQIKSMFHIPAFPIIGLTSIYTKLFAGYKISEVSALKQVALSKTPILFIHGSEDSFVPAHMLDALYEACPCEKERLLVQGTGHGTSMYKNPDLYWGSIDDFLKKHMV